jgi:glycosyltransferase involved in cell wall biosynthesis
MIQYFCPDSTLKSSGIRLLYKHVALLNRHGLDAAILHHKAGFRLEDVPEVPVRYLSETGALHKGDIVVIPEGFAKVMDMLKEHALRRIAIALNWSYIFPALHQRMDWRNFGIERVLVNSPFVGDFISWSMNLPIHLFAMGIDPQLYYHTPAEKIPQISYIERKKTDCESLQRVLHSRNPAFVTEIAWKGHSGLSQAEYAAEIRKSVIFLNMSPAEGLPFSMLEAMRAGTLVAGYNGVGGQRELIGAGETQNCVLSENLDYVNLARKLEPLLSDVLEGDLSRWDHVLRAGIELSNRYTLEEEERTVLGMWKEILDG